MVTCPHCQKEFDPKSGNSSSHLSGKTFQWAFLLILLAMGLYQLGTNSAEQQLLSSVTNFRGELGEAYEVFDKVSSNIQGRIAKQVRVRVKTNDIGTVTTQAKELIAAERNNNPTNLIYLYFYLTDKDPSTLPLESWFAKVTYVNFVVIRDLAPGDFLNAKSIAPGTYLEVKN
ncbi:MAG: hypothetical protein HY817_05945 [Candidatus Abawacabacteria bacterium]|nr:hypothetical protein [Candidatus Abawacabacteria bacterium]